MKWFLSRKIKMKITPEVLRVFETMNLNYKLHKEDGIEWHCLTSEKDKGFFLADRSLEKVVAEIIPATRLLAIARERHAMEKRLSSVRDFWDKTLTKDKKDGL